MASVTKISTATVSPMAFAIPSYASLSTPSTVEAPFSKKILSNSCLRKTKREGQEQPVARATSQTHSGSTEDKGRMGMEKRSKGQAPATRRGRRRQSQNALAPFFISDSWDLIGFPATQTLRQMINTFDRSFDNFFYFPAEARTRYETAARSLWDVNETDDAYHFRVDFPGLSKDDIKVYVDDTVLCIKAEPKHHEEEHDDQQNQQQQSEEKMGVKGYENFEARIALPEDAEVDKIQAEVKNGVLLVKVPKSKSEQKKEVHNVHVT